MPDEDARSMSDRQCSSSRAVCPGALKQRRSCDCLLKGVGLARAWYACRRAIAIGAMMMPCLWNSSFRLGSCGLMAMLDTMSGPLSTGIVCLARMGTRPDEDCEHCVAEEHYESCHHLRRARLPVRTTRIRSEADMA